MCRKIVRPKGLSSYAPLAVITSGVTVAYRVTLDFRDQDHKQLGHPGKNI